MTSTPSLDPSGQRRAPRSLKGRTSLVTAAAIAGVLIAGTAAVAANIGILNAADSSAIGDLAATDELLPATGVGAATVMVEAPSTTATTSTTTPPTSDAQRYDIENTGTVWIMTTTSGLALDHIVAEPAWTPVLSQGDLRSLRVEFTNGDRTIVFTAVLADDGSVVVDVTEPTTVVAPAPTNAGTQSNTGATPPPVASGYEDDSYEDDSYEDDSYEDHSYEDNSYEDDSYEEHDGAEDDD